MSSAPTDNDAAKVYNAMLRLLTRRDYSRLELKQKLYPKYDKSVVDAALERCIESNYQSDERTAQMLLRHCQFSLFGPYKFTVLAYKKGLDKDYCKSLVIDVDWVDIAAEALHKKYHDYRLELYEDQQKALAFLARRGFLKDHCYKALEQFCASFN